MKKNNLEICHFITTIARGGAENQLLILVRNQVNSGKKVKVVPLKGQLELLEELVEVGVEVDKTFVNKLFVIQVLKMWLGRRNKFDVYHAHLPQAELLLAFSPIKDYVITRHFGGQFYPEASEMLSRFLSRISSSRASKIIAISEAVKNTLIELKEIKVIGKIKVIPYGFNASKYTQNVKSKRQNSSSIMTIGTLARLSSEKDLSTLIKGFQILRMKIITVRYEVKIFGEGNRREEIQSLIDDLELGEYVHLMGRTMHPAEEISRFDVFVLTSKFEGFGLVLLEAMAFNKPIITSRIPAALEILGEDGAGIFFEPGNEKELANRIENLDSLLDENFIQKQKDRLMLFDDIKMEEMVYSAYCRN
jgi:glycosyltransferase involved in cell wall biosynthesis